jgi:hypothetical protein
MNTAKNPHSDLFQLHCCVTFAVLKPYAASSNSADGKNEPGAEAVDSNWRP